MVIEMKKKFIIFIIIVLAIACIVFRMYETKKSEKNQQMAIQQMMTPKVSIMEPYEIETSSTIDAPGRIVAVKTSDVIARAQGFILQQHFKEGDIVREGQLLYSIDPNAYKINLDKAQAGLEQAKASQYDAQKQFERARELVKKDFVSKSHYDTALSQRDLANANVHSAIANVNDAKRLLNYTKVTAPITGKISMTDVTVGNYLSSPTTVLTKIVSIDPIYVTYSLDSGLYGKLKDEEILPKAGKRSNIKVQITLPDGTVYDKDGYADFTDNTVSPTTGTITMRATFKNPNGVLIPGDFVEVKVYSSKIEKKLAVPQSAVLQDTEGRYLFVIDENNIAHKRIIEAEGEKGNDWIIKSGIEKGEKFISTGISKVRDNAPVEIISNSDSTPVDENVVTTEKKNEETKSEER